MENRPKVVLGIIENKGNVLLINRRIHASHLSWAFPGGMTEEGETDEAAVVREVQEEVGLDVEAEEKFGERKHPNTFVQVAYYRCRMKDPNQQPINGDDEEIEEVQWVSAREALERFTSDVDPAVRKYLESLS